MKQYIPKQNNAIHLNTKQHRTTVVYPFNWQVIN